MMTVCDCVHCAAHTAATANFRQIRPLHVNRGWNAELKTKIWGSFAPKTRNFKGVKQVPHSEQATGQGIHCREILFIPRCSPRAREFAISVNFSVGHTLAELWGFKVAQFSDFGLFPPYKTRKTYLPVTSLQPRGYIAEWFRFFHVIVEGPKCACRHLRFLATSGRGAGYPQTCPNFRL